MISLKIALSSKNFLHSVIFAKKISYGSLYYSYSMENHLYCKINN